MRKLLPLLLLCAPLAAQFGTQEDYLNLGVIGIGAELGADGFLHVRKLYPDGAAAAADVRVGDKIVAVGGRAIGDREQVETVIGAIEKAEQKGKEVELGIERGGATLELEIATEKLGKHGRKCPEKCDKCSAVIERGLAFLAAAQDSDGCFPTELGGKTGKVVVTSLGGLAFLAAGVKPKPGNPLDRALQYVMRNCNVEERSPFGDMGGMGGGGNWNQTNWELGYGLMFLSEMARRTGSAEIAAKCQEIVTQIERNQEASGGWAHGPGGPNALGYLELEIVMNYLLLGLGGAKRLGLEVDDGRILRSLAWIEATSSGDGGIGYSDRQGQKGYGEAGRTAGAILAFAAVGGAELPFFERMVNFYTRTMDTLQSGHVSPAMHLLAGAMASRLLGKRAWSAFMDQYRLHIMGQRLPDGSFASTPTEESTMMRNNTDISVGSCWLTATYVLILSLPNDKLPSLLGGDDVDPVQLRDPTGD